MRQANCKIAEIFFVSASLFNGDEGHSAGQYLWATSCAVSVADQGVQGKGVVGLRRGCILGGFGLDSGNCWRAISIASRLRSFAFQLAIATSLDETYPLRGTLQTVQRDVRTSYGDVHATNFNIVPTSTSTDIGQLLIINIG